MSRVFTVVTVAAAFAMVAFNLWGPGALSPWAKMTASTAFICLAVSVGAHTWNYGRIMLAGLFFSWWGDWFLTGGGDTRFLLGLVSFLTAHVLYCVAFGVRGINWRWAAAALPVVAAVTGAALVWLSPHVGPDMTWPVRAYTGVISVMVILSFGAKGAGGPWAIPIGAVLFYFSDISVASGQFVKPDFPNYVWGLPFYFIGQVFLAASAKRVATAEPVKAAARSAA
jgi:uncharacterized membrane protein YhhN